MPESNERSAEWLRGAIAVCDDVGQRIAAAIYRKALAAAEARESGEANSLPVVSMGGTQMSGNTTDSTTAAEVIEAAEKALDEIDDYRGGAETVLEDDYVTQRRMDALALCARWKEKNGVNPGSNIT